MSVLVAAGVVALIAGALVGSRRLAPGLGLQSVGVLAFGAAGAWSLWRGTTWGSGFTSDLGAHAGIDGLSGVFLLTLAIVACPALVFATAYVRPGRAGHVSAVLTSGFLLALVGVVCARDALSFLFCWELMTLLPAAVILTGSCSESARHTVFTYVAVTHLGGAGTWIALLLLAHEGALGGAPPAQGSGVQIAIALAAIVGFGTKAGLMPMHAWLPRAHPIAPAHVSAVMSGAMVAVAAYGLVRVLVDWLGPLPSSVGVLVLALGALSALGGITYALFQRDLKRLLAYSTVEHVGIVALALGACVVLRANGSPQWASFALGAALLHVINHGAFKSLLFLGAGTIERATGSVEVDRLGGLLRRLPWTGSAFLVGALAIAGVPLLNGFASEWLTLQALVHVPATAQVWDGAIAALGLAALAATMGIAALCFVKVIGLALLGPPRRTACAEALEPPRAMHAATTALAACCLLLGTVPGLVLTKLVALAPWDARGTVPKRPGLDLPGTGHLPTIGILVVLGGLTALLWAARGGRRAAPSPSWACGQPVTAGLLWSSAGFSKPLRLVLEPVLRPEREITVRSHGGVVQDVTYAGQVPALIDERVYRPATATALRGAALARRLQSGSLSAYVIYLIALVLVLLLAVRIGWIG